MSDLDDELVSGNHRLKPDVYYRCPASETLNGALRNELHQNATSLIPVEIVTEFVFAANSTITIPVIQQGNLDALGVISADVPQSLTVEYALCRDIEGKDRLKTQRAVARSLIDVIQGIDGFQYTERQAFNKEGTDGTRFKYICMDSLQNRDRKANRKKVKEGEEETEAAEKAAKTKPSLPTFDCGGAIHIKFSTKRDAVNVVYKHNPIHRDVESRPMNGRNGNSSLLPLQEGANAIQPPTDVNAPKPKRKRRTKKQMEEANGYSDHLDMSTSPEASKAQSKKHKKSDVSGPPEATRTSSKKSKKNKQVESPSKARASNKPSTYESPPEPAVSRPIGGRACIRCREKKIKCNEAKPSCNQCKRGLWTCQYELEGPKKRSKNGCLNCRQRKRKCGEQKPSCAYCLKVDDDCEYPE
ncbi:hypothetical protein K491DRAFT_699236 [Lophiostoma macrostomum CBS 122681]|uniref:Zn(2)-C6 fungal-type domain-containing protein n=1 Tax=Lophiostoma macrostomum CBS 122681 TaxID=1314788 RepID=A0A6A6SPD8_9PLEO|nr:hypothetical protein K491DRAFT_699236 [Lophiostoma macrostomum CBS 122681]